MKRTENKKICQIKVTGKCGKGCRGMSWSEPLMTKKQANKKFRAQGKKACTEWQKIGGNRKILALPLKIINGWRAAWQRQQSSLAGRQMIILVLSNLSKSTFLFALFID